MTDSPLSGWPVTSKMRRMWPSRLWLPGTWEKMDTTCRRKSWKSLVPCRAIPILTYLTTFYWLQQCFLCGARVSAMVIGPATMAIYLYRSRSKWLPACGMSAARQLLKALECLHNAGIVHHSELTPARHSPTRHANYSTDLNHGNIMWAIKPLDNFKTETKYKHQEDSPIIQFMRARQASAGSHRFSQIYSLSWWLQYGDQSRHWRKE